MTALDKWLGLYESPNRDVRIRAARALLERPDAPLSVLLDILEKYSRDGLCAHTEKALLKRDDAELAAEMIACLDSPDEFIREVACRVLGQTGDPAATPRLLGMIDDLHMRVRCAAGFALAELKDPSAIPELKRQFAQRRNDDTNVVWALQSALQALGVNSESAR